VEDEEGGEEEIAMIQGGAKASKRRPSLKICSHPCLPLFMCVAPAPPSLLRGENSPFSSFFPPEKNGG